MTSGVESGPTPALLRRHEEIGGRRESLARRLDDGYRRIDEALREGTDVADWERFWIQLLHEYEAVCDDLRVAA